MQFTIPTKMYLKSFQFLLQVFFRLHIESYFIFPISMGLHILVVLDTEIIL